MAMINSPLVFHPLLFILDEEGSDDLIAQANCLAKLVRYLVCEPRRQITDKSDRLVRPFGLPQTTNPLARIPYDVRRTHQSAKARSRASSRIKNYHTPATTGSACRLLVPAIHSNASIHSPRAASHLSEPPASPGRLVACITWPFFPCHYPSTAPHSNRRLRRNETKQTKQSGPASAIPARCRAETGINEPHPTKSTGKKNTKERKQCRPLSKPRLSSSAPRASARRPW